MRLFRVVIVSRVYSILLWNIRIILYFAWIFQNHDICHTVAKSFVCEVCQFSCKRIESLRVHMRRHASIKPYQCGLCGKEYTQKNALETHLRLHTGASAATCNMCGREFLTKYQLVLHMKRKHANTDDVNEGVCYFSGLFHFQR